MSVPSSIVPLLEAECCYCHSSMYTPLYPTTDMYGDVYTLNACNVCRANYLSPQPTASALARAYSDDYYGEQETKFTGIFEKVLSYFRSRRARLVAHYMPAPAKVLDIGCGNGQFLQYMQQQGNYEIYGVELPGKAALRAAKIPRIHLKIGVLEEDDFVPQSLDVVTMFHVIEHLPEPAKVLQLISKIVKTGGIAVISFPNIDSWQSRFFKGKWLHLDPPRHLWFFTPTDFAAEMNRLGFDNLRTRHFNPEYNPFGAQQSWLNLFLKKRDVLYEYLKKNNAYTRDYSPLALYMQYLFFILSFPIFVFTDIIAACCSKSATVEMVFKKR